MAVESDVAVVIGGSEDGKELGDESIKLSGNEIVHGGENGGHNGGDDSFGSFGSGSGESKTGSNGSDDSEADKNRFRIMVSGRKKPLFFYINLAKKYLIKAYDVELSALGLAIPTVITVSEYLKRNGFGAEKNIHVSTITKMNEEKGRAIMKAQIEILLGPRDKMDELTAELSVS